VRVQPTRAEEGWARRNRSRGHGRASLRTASRSPRAVRRRPARSGAPSAATASPFGVRCRSARCAAAQRGSTRRTERPGPASSSGRSY